uniref:Zinc finger CCHC domain-containing protein 4 n=1 Tax=Cacopsylla melanoneura TaxID=428564 RepID=A0A8D8YV91_9HEMI
MNDSSNTIPECPHGPMLLFPKYGKNKAVVSRVFACSAYRSSKECPFSMREDSKMSSEKEMMLEDMKKTSLPQLDIGALKNRSFNKNLIRRKNPNFTSLMTPQIQY